MGKNWIEPLLSWILDIQKAKKLSQGDNFEDIKAFVQKVGTNHQLLDKSASFSFSAPWDYVALRKAQSHQAESQSGEATPSEKIGSTIWWRWPELNRRPTRLYTDNLRAYFQKERNRFSKI